MRFLHCINSIRRKSSFERKKKGNKKVFEVTEKRERESFFRARARRRAKRGRNKLATWNGREAKRVWRVAWRGTRRGWRRRRE